MCKYLTVLGLLTVGLLLSDFATVSAQPSRWQPWISVGGAFGHSGPANSAGHDRQNGHSLQAGVGVSLSPRLLAVLDASLWRTDGSIGSARSDFVTVSLLGYPFTSAVQHLYLHVGLGVGSASYPTRVVTIDSSRLTVTRPAFALGIGYDLPVFCPLWVTPFVQSLNTMGGRRSSRIKTGEGSNGAVLLQIGASLRYHRTGSTAGCTSRGS